MNRATLHLHIDQPIPDGEKGLEIIDRYIDDLAKTEGELTWFEVDWTLTEIDGTQLDNDGKQE